MKSKSADKIKQHKNDFMKFETDVETYIIDKQKDSLEDDDNISIVNKVSKQSRANAHASCMSTLAKFEEAQKTAEFLARAKAVRDKHELARKKLELEFQEELNLMFHRQDKRL